MRKFVMRLGLMAIAAFVVSSAVAASPFVEPWRDKGRALVIDAYEYNEFDLIEIAKNPRVAAFIHKGSDGVPPPYRCAGNSTEQELCKQRWRRYAVGRELYHTRRALAKTLGLKWGAYHLGRPGDPLEQARHFLDYTDPTDDELIVLDIEENDASKWMSLKDAERFAIYIKQRTGRYPMLYTNGSTSKHIADNRSDYPVLSRLQLWYARYKPSIADHFPKGNWDTYSLWQFSAQVNCNKRACPYRLKGAGYDIDVNVADMSVDELKAAWPFGMLVEDKMLPEDMPLPVARPDAEGDEDVMMAANEDGAIISEPVSAALAYSAYAQSRGIEVSADIDSTETSSIPTRPAAVNDLF